MKTAIMFSFSYYEVDKDKKKDGSRKSEDGRMVTGD